jgi:ribosomal protein L40E
MVAKNETAQTARSDEAERDLARFASWGLPIGTVVGSVAIGTIFGPGPAVLVLAAGALIGVIGLLWASIRTLGGDAPLAEGLAEAGTTRALRVTDADERKRRVLRALKDLELEHQVGKIDDADYAKISARYREQAKAILREMDVAVEPLRERAEKLARTHMKKVGLGREPEDEKREPSRGEASAEPASRRVACAKCGTSNEPDATFCKKCGAQVNAPETSEVTDASA